jgi:hypothetical protein
MPRQHLCTSSPRQSSNGPSPSGGVFVTDCLTGALYGAAAQQRRAGDGKIVKSVTSDAILTYQTSEPARENRRARSHTMPQGSLRTPRMLIRKKLASPAPGVHESMSKSWGDPSPQPHRAPDSAVGLVVHHPAPDASPSPVPCDVYRQVLKHDC